MWRGRSPYHFRFLGPRLPACGLILLTRRGAGEGGGVVWFSVRLRKSPGGCQAEAASTAIATAPRRPTSGDMMTWTGMVRSSSANLPLAQNASMKAL